MKNFETWLNNNHPEILEEDFKDFLKKGALATGILSSIAGGVSANPPEIQKPAISQSFYKNLKARKDAMNKVSDVSLFLKNWKNEFSDTEMKKVFDSILKLETEKDHEIFIDKITKDMKDMLKTIGHPNKSVQEADVRQITKSYRYQYLNYIKTLALASKLNL